MKLRLTIEAGPGVRTSFEHGGPVIQIGRDPECELSLQGEASTAVSRRHARIDLSATGATLADTGSSNGTLLNGQPLNAPAPLRVGDRIQMGYTGATLTVVEIDVAAPPAIPAPPLNRAVLIGSLAAVAVAAVAVVAGFLLREPKATQQVAEVRPAQRSVEGPPSTTPADKEKNRAEPAPKEPPPPPPLVPKELPRDDEKKVGSFVAGDKNWISVLVQRKAEANPWAVLQNGDLVYTANTLVSLPGYRSLLALDSGVNLMLWGTLPEFTAFPPLLESSVMLNAPEPGFDLDFTLDCGRVHVANRKEPKGPVKLRLRFLRETWDLELADANSEVVLELWAKPTEITADGSRSKPYLCLGVFTSGKVKVQTPRQRYEDLAGCTRLSWATVAPDREHRETLPEKPAWWAKAPDNKEERIQKALRSLLDWGDVLGANPAKAKRPEKDRESLAATIKAQVKNVRDPDNQDLGVLLLAALDDVESLLTFLEDSQNPNVRNVTLYALQTWLSRGNQNVDRLTEILKKRFDSEPQAKRVVRLLHFLSKEALTKKETYEELVRGLDDDNQQVRDLAYWHLDKLGVAGLLPPEAKNIDYKPTFEREQRRPAIEQWNQLIRGGKVPVTSGR